MKRLNDIIIHQLEKEYSQAVDMILQEEMYYQDLEDSGLSTEYDVAEMEVTFNAIQLKLSRLNTQLVRLRNDSRSTSSETNH